MSSGSRSRSTQTAQSCSISWSVSSIAASIPSPSRSSLISFSSSTSRLSNWTTTRSCIVARSIGAMSMSGAAVTSIPPEWIERWRGKPSIRAQNSSQRSQSDMPTVEPPRACGGGSGSTRATDEWSAVRRPIACGPGGAGRIPVVRPAEPVGRPASAGRGGRACRSPGSIAPARRSSAGADEPVAIRRVAGAAARPQPGHARRRVARAALVVGRPPGRIAGGDSGAPSHIPDRRPGDPPRSQRRRVSAGPAPSGRRRLSPSGRHAPSADRRLACSQANGSRRVRDPPPSAAGATAAPCRRAASGCSAGPSRRRAPRRQPRTARFSWPIPSTSRAPPPRAPRPPRPAAPRPAAGRTRRTRRRPRGRAGP